MKIDRLMSILTLLLNREQITAPELARRLEVSRRTIGRDIDALCQAGIPIVTRQGGGGGISIAEGYKLDHSLLTREDRENILIGLRSLHTVGGGVRLETLLQSLSPGAHDALAVQDSVVIDLASHYQESLSHKISLLREAVAGGHPVSFDYYSPEGKSRRTVEPCFVVFKWSAWYVFGYCRTREDFRLFKLGRLWELAREPGQFVPRNIPPEKLDLGAHLADGDPMELLFHPRGEYLLIEAYGPDSYTRREDGFLHFRGSFTNREYIIRWILGFGSLAQVIHPPDLRREVEEELRRTGEHYRSSDG